MCDLFVDTKGYTGGNQTLPDHMCNKVSVLCVFAVCLDTSATGQTGSWSKWTSGSLFHVSVLSLIMNPGSSQTYR